MTFEETKRLMGTIVDPKWAIFSPKKQETQSFLSSELPDSFDAREAWPECKNVIGHVRDQSNCGSCWAHGSTEAFNDRLCIKTKGSFNTLLSIADTAGCCGFFSCLSFGCAGGHISSAWDWFKKTGVVTGGDFGDKNSCYPYTMPFCAHQIEGTPYKKCEDIEVV